MDDEELALSRLSGLLAELESIELCGMFSTAVAALEYIEDNPVDVVFLDISMPEMDGMEFANLLLNRGSSAKVVFVTGYGEYAVEAFELNAMDYLLKPISRERLVKTVQRLTKPHRGEELRLCINCFGGFSVSVYGNSNDVISWRSPKVEELFAFLICKGNVSRDEIADTLWDGFAPDKAMKNINSTVYYIRRALQQYGLEDCLVTTHRQISMNTKKIYCDLYEFERLQKTAWNTERGLVRLDALYQGELFQGKTYEWSFAKALALEESLILNLVKAAQLRERQEQLEEAEQLYRRILELNPFHEEIYRHLISIYTKRGHKRKAQKLHRQLEHFLLEETAVSAQKPSVLRKQL